MLLSQAQVSVAVSSTIVVTFTILLFLSGYIYQQQTVQGLKEAIKPRIPQKPPSLNVQDEQQHATSNLQRSRFFSQSNDRIVYTDVNIDMSSAGADVNWNRLAHIQLVRTHHDVCNAIMILAELHRLRSPARRVLMFPKEWAAEKEASKGDISDPYLSATRRLMRMAARRYHVDLRPISSVGHDSETYSLASAFALSEFDRVLSIETPGMLLDAEPLDAILAFTEATPLAMLHDTYENDGVHAEDLFLLLPSQETHRKLTAQLLQSTAFNDTLLPTHLGDPLLLASSSEDSALVRSIGSLHDVPSPFNQTAFLSNVAYMRFSDPKLPGPEYDVPWASKRAARPKNKDADWAWTKLYTDFAQKRMEICGLDLEAWRP